MSCRHFWPFLLVFAFQNRLKRFSSCAFSCPAIMEPTPQMVLDQWYIPPDTPEQRLQYYDRAADVLYDLINDLTDLWDSQETDSDDEPITLFHDEEIHAALYQIQIVTTAFQDGHYRAAALVLDIAREFRNLTDINVMLLAFSNLRELYTHVPRESDRRISIWLFRHHINFISRYLRVPIPADPPLPVWCNFSLDLTSLPPSGGVCVNTPRDTGLWVFTQSNRHFAFAVRKRILRHRFQHSKQGGSACLTVTAQRRHCQSMVIWKGGVSSTYLFFSDMARG